MNELLLLITPHLLPLSAGLGATLLLLLVTSLLGWRRRRQMAKQMRALRDQLAETDELLLKERSALGHCRERMSAQEQSFAPTKAQLKAMRKLLLVAEVGEDGSLLGANRRLLRLLGSEEGPPPAWPDGWLAAWLQAQPRLHEGKAWQGRVSLGTDTPNALWLQIGPLATPEGEPRRYLAVASELSPLERRHRELIDSLERQGELLEGLQAGGWAWDCAGDRLRLDRRLLAMLGLPAAGPVSTPAQAFLNERLHPEDAPGWRNAVQALLQGRAEGLRMALRLRHTDGSWRHFQARGGAARRGAEGEVLRLAGGLLPLAEPTPGAAGDWEALLAGAQRGLGQGALRWEPVADLLHWNAAALDLLERAEAPPLPLELALLALHADDRAPLKDALHAAARGERWQGELRLLGALGSERRVRLSLAGGAEAVLGLLQPLPNTQRTPLPVLPAALVRRAAAQGLELTRAIQRFGGDMALLQRTARDLAASSRELPAQLRAALPEPASLREATQALHAFQAVAGTLGCEALAQVARSGLQRLRGGQVPEPAWIDEFAQRRQSTLEALLAAGNELLAPRLVEELEPTVGPDLEQLRRLVAAADPQAQTLLRLQREQLAPWLGERAEPLDAALAAADYETAKALLAA